MSIDRSVLWTVIVVLGVGTYLIRFSFLGLLGGRVLPRWLMRGLKFTAVAVLPGLIAPAILWPAATGGVPDPARLAAAFVTVLVGVVSRSMMAAIIGGALTLYLVPVVFG